MKKRRKYLYRTDILFPRVKTLTGAGTVFNLSGQYFDFNRSQSGVAADHLALSNDWGVVGQDIEKVIEKHPTNKLLEKIK